MGLWDLGSGQCPWKPSLKASPLACFVSAVPGCSALPHAGIYGVFIELLLGGCHRISWVWGPTVRGRVMKEASGTPIPESCSIHSRSSIASSSQYPLSAYCVPFDPACMIFLKGRGRIWANIFVNCEFHCNEPFFPFLLGDDKISQGLKDID